MGLSAAEKKMLEKLQAKAEEPDPPQIARSLTASINLGNKDEVALAKKYGFLPPDDDDEDDTGGDEDEADDAPKRKGYFEK